jgi:hypothetical protein
VIAVRTVIVGAPLLDQHLLERTLGRKRLDPQPAAGHKNQFPW